MFTGGGTTGVHDGQDESAASTGVAEPRWRVVLRLLEDNARTRVKLEAIETELILEADACDLHRHLGYSSLAELLERHLHYSRHAANERIRVARELQALPQLRAGYQAGALSFAHVRELTRIATPQTEGAYLAAAAGKTSRQVQQLCSGKKAGDAPEAPPDPALVKHTIVLELGGEAFAMWRRAQQVLEDEVGERLSMDELVMQLCSQAFAPAVCAAVATDETSAVSPDRAPAPEVGSGQSRGRDTMMRTGDSAMRTGDAAEVGSDRSCGTGAALRPAEPAPTAERARTRARGLRVAPPLTLHAVTTCRRCQRATVSAVGSAEPLTPAQRDRALCDAIHVGDLETSDRTRPTLTVPSAIRRKVAIACHHACVVPGCRSRRFLTIHHLRYQAHGGGHTVENCILLCFAHHARLHEGRLRIEGTAPHGLDIAWRHPATTEELDAGADAWVWRRVPPDPVAHGRGS